MNPKMKQGAGRSVVRMVRLGMMSWVMLASSILGSCGMAGVVAAEAQAAASGAAHSDAREAGASAGQANPGGGSQIAVSDDAAAGSDWLTWCERSAFRETPRYEDTIAYCKRLAEASPLVEYSTFGTSPQGRDLPLLVVATDNAFTPEAAQSQRAGKEGKLVVLIQNCIHAGECAGKDASLMFLRDLVIEKANTDLLDNLILVVIPIFSVDGHERFSPYSRINQVGPAEMGWRVNARNQNLNRDYVKLDTPEMAALLQLWNAWRPDFLIDNHSTDGGNWQYDMALLADTSQTAPPAIAKWVKQTLEPAILPALKDEGHLVLPYFWLEDDFDPRKGIRTFAFSGRYSTGYASLRCRPSLLVETHALKPYRTRVLGHYDVMLQTLDVLFDKPETLRTAIDAAESDVVQMGSIYDPNKQLPLVVKSTDEADTITFKGVAYERMLSPVSGQIRIIYDETKPIEFDVPFYNKTETTVSITPPLGYLIPAEYAYLADLAQMHGLHCLELTESVKGQFQSYRFASLKWPDGPFEGRFMPEVEAVPITEERTYPAGSVFVPVGQADGLAAIELFEPQARDSLVRWGFFNATLERKEYAEPYVAERLAEEMLAGSADLRAQFEEKIATDKAFAADASARLDFFYQRSPFYDDHVNVYPIARVTRLPGVKMQRYGR